MAGQWHVRIAGKQRESVDIELLVQAVVALGRQLAREQNVPLDRVERPDSTNNASQGVDS
jgi:hypothetical protein